MKHIRVLLFIAIVTALIVSCTKVIDVIEDIRISEDNALSNQAIDDVKYISDQAIETNKIGELKREDAGAILSDSVKITRDTVGSNINVTVDFGTGFTAKNGRVYKGKVIFTANFMRYKEVGYKSSTTFSDFSINGNMIENSSTISAENIEANDNLIRWTYSVNYTIIKPDGTKILAKANAEKKQTEGVKTLVWADDVYEGTGTTTGTASNGVSYSIEIQKPLVQKMDCNWISEGTIYYSKNNNKSEKTLDFGSRNECDSKANLSVLGVTKEINMK